MKKANWWLVALTAILLSCGPSAVEKKKNQDSVINALEKEIEKSTQDFTAKLHEGEIKMNDTLEKELKKLKETKDEFKKIAFYKCKDQSKYWANAVSMYLGKTSEDYIYGRFMVEYKGDDWLFITNYQFSCDGNIIDYTPESEPQRDNGGGDVYEYLDVNFGPHEKEIVLAIINAKVAKIRCNGKQYYKDRVISDKEKKNLKLVYDILNRQ